jgi:UDP-N-acetylglucosamine 2-epimerase (non-hydrolysing)
VRQERRDAREAARHHRAVGGDRAEMGRRPRLGGPSARRPSRGTRRRTPGPRVLLVVGARPNFIKAAALVRALTPYRRSLDVRLVHTDQHRDWRMSAVFFRDLALPSPAIHLGVRARGHAAQIGRTLQAAERYFRRLAPDLVVVFGDVNSTLAAALAAQTLGIPLAHVEAGLRSFDPTMPEERNRRLTDAMSTYLFTTCRDAGRNLLREGIPRERIFFVGNVMVDALRAVRPAPAAVVHRRFAVRRRAYAVLTLHRPANVDRPQSLGPVVLALLDIADRIPILFPMHPRTQGHWDGLLRRDPALAARVKEATDRRRLRLLPPLGYREFQRLLRDARFVLTDSGGIQEESSALAIPCLTLRERTERPVTVTQGTNRLVGGDARRIRRAVARILAGDGVGRRRPIERWDGRAAERIVAILRRALRSARPGRSGGSAGEAPGSAPKGRPGGGGWSRLISPRRRR